MDTGEEGQRENLELKLPKSLVIKVFSCLVSFIASGFDQYELVEETRLHFNICFGH
jgi:hypothetical protein